MLFYAYQKKDVSSFLQLQKVVVQNSWVFFGMGVVL